MLTRNLLTLTLVGCVLVLGAALAGYPLWGLLLGPLPFILGATPIADSDTVRTLVSWGILDAAGGLKRLRISAQTGNYAVLLPTILATGDPSGTIFTNRGAAGAVTFTLPAVTLAMFGLFYDFVGVANQTFTVAGTAGQVVTFNNAAATSVACSTAGAKIGNHIRAYCDGVSWHLNGDTVGGTYTVA